MTCTSGSKKLLQFDLRKTCYLPSWEPVDVQKDLCIFSNDLFPVLFSAHRLNFGRDQITVVRPIFPLEGISNNPLCGRMGLQASRGTFWHFTNDWFLAFLPPSPNANPSFIANEVILFSPKVKQFVWENSTLSYFGKTFEREKQQKEWFTEGTSPVKR